LSSLVDNILLLNWVELGDTFRLGLTVAKMRANPTIHVTREAEIVEGIGMRILPREAGLLPTPMFADHHGLISRAPERRPRESGNPLLTGGRSARSKRPPGGRR
jgi:hypothetical protein